MRAAVVGLFVVVCFSVSAQIEEPDSVNVTKIDPDTLRAYFIESFPDHFFLYPVIKQRSLSFGLEKRDRSEQLTFKPNNSYSLGIGGYLFEVGAELTFSVPIDEKSKSIYGESDSRDVQLNILGKTWGGDLFYQKYQGFYLTDRENPVLPGSAFPQRGDIVSRNFGLTANYVFQNRKFSFRSAYNFAERQLHSKGSFLLFASLSSFKMGADSSILSSAQKDVFGENVSFTRLRYTTFSVAPGYTYSLIFRNFFVNGTLSVGPAHHWITYKVEGERQRTDIAINSFIAARIAIGYNGPRLFGGLIFFSQGSNVRFEDVQFSNNNGTFKILIGYRFREFGFLKKRAWDLLPFRV
jgi:hypothetical protein